MLINIYNKYFPPEIVSIIKKSVPWITGEIKDRDKAKKIIRTHENWIEYECLTNLTKPVIIRGKCNYFYNRRIKDMWKELKSLNISSGLLTDLYIKF